MRITARADYAVRAMVEIATAGARTVLTAEDIAERQDIPRTFLLGILAELRKANLVDSVRGSGGGWRLTHPAGAVTLAMVVRAVEGPLAWVNGARPETLEYPESIAALRLVWIALRANIREVLENVTVAEIAAGSLPEGVLSHTREPDSWVSR